MLLNGLHKRLTRRRVIPYLGFIMAARATNYDSWSLQELRDEATKRCIYFPRKDGVKTLASKLRTFDRLDQSSGDEGENENLAKSAQDTSLSFEQRLQLQEREM